MLDEAEENALQVDIDILHVLRARITSLSSLDHQSQPHFLPHIAMGLRGRYWRKWQQGVEHTNMQFLKLGPSPRVTHHHLQRLTDPPPSPWALISQAISGPGPPTPRQPTPGVFWVFGHGPCCLPPLYTLLTQLFPPRPLLTSRNRCRRCSCSSGAVPSAWDTRLEARL